MRSERARGRFLRIRVLVAAGTAFCLASQTALVSRAEDPPDFLVVVNAANPAESLTSEEVSRFLLKKVSKWASGLAVLPVDQSEDSPARAAFSLQVHHRRVGSVRIYWQQRIFSGRDIPPPIRTSDAEVIRYVESNPGAIGYVSGEAVLSEKVRVIDLDGASP